VVNLIQKMVIKQQKLMLDFHGILTTVVRAQNDASKTANITLSIPHVELYTRPYQRHAANWCDETVSSV